MDDVLAQGEVTLVDATVGKVHHGQTEPGSLALPPPVIHFGPVSVTGGRVDFYGRFIKPNYSARLSELTGKLNASNNIVLNQLKFGDQVPGAAKAVPPEAKWQPRAELNLATE